MIERGESQTVEREQEQVTAKGPPIGVRLPSDVQAALEKLAKADDRSLSYVINKILAEYLRARKLIK
jgi:predicted transcriptional regulator